MVDIRHHTLPKLIGLRMRYLPIYRLCRGYLLSGLVALVVAHKVRFQPSHIERETHTDTDTDRQADRDRK